MTTMLDEPDMLDVYNALRSIFRDTKCLGSNQ